MPRPAILVVPVATLALLAGCGTTAAPTPAQSPEPSYTVTGDGVLRIGTLFSASAPDSLARVAAVEVAVREINENGGFGGAKVEVLHRNAGDDPAAVPAIVTGLVDRGIDVVIGGSTPALAEAIAGAAGDVAYIEPGITAVPDATFGARLLQSDPGIGTTVGAVEAYEATLLAALAALAAGDDGGLAITRTLPELITGPSTCATYGACLDVLDVVGEIDYLGLAGTGITIAARKSSGALVG